MMHLGGSAFQGGRRGQTDTHLGSGPVPASAAQRSQADPVAAAGLRRLLLGPLNRVSVGLRQMHSDQPLWVRRR